MNYRKIGIIFIAFLFTACASIPKETVLLSETIGSDLQILHKSHRNIVELHYKKIKTDINHFVDEVYAPFVIHYVLKKELQSFDKGEISLYRTIELARKKDSKQLSEDALNAMADFQNAARRQIQKKRNELLMPITEQETEVVKAINESYEQITYANTSVTSYLKSLRKLKSTQQEALSVVGLKGLDTKLSTSLIKVSNQIESVVEKGKEIDVKSDDAYKKLENLSNKIKALSNKK